MHLGRYPVPPENQQGEETRLEEEGEYALRRQRRTEDIADETRVGGPVGAELELHDDAGGDTDREVEGEDPGPEPPRPVEQRIAGPQVLGFQIDHHHTHPDGQGWENVVKGNGQGKLETRQEDDIHRLNPFHFLTRRCRVSRGTSMVLESTRSGTENRFLLNRPNRVSLSPMKITLFFLVFVLLGLTNGNANTVETPADVAAPPDGAVCTESGLCSAVLTAGTGDVHPDAWDEVTVHYSGWTTDGSMFDSSVQRGQPATFPLNRVIPGWTEGLQLMVVGEKRRFWIPKELAYNDTPGRPAGMLVFDVELLSIDDKPAPPPPPPVPEDVAAPPADAETTASGLASKVLRPGVGDAHPTATSTVTAHYSGWTTDGKLFDSSVAAR